MVYNVHNCIWLLVQYFIIRYEIGQWNCSSKRTRDESLCQILKSVKICPDENSEWLMIH